MRSSQRLSKLLGLLLLTLFADQMNPQVASGSQIVTPKEVHASANSPRRKVIGIALEGGGAIGLAHIGVLLWLEDHRVPIDRIAGTSMGALIGGLYATGSSPQQIQALANAAPFQQVFSLQSSFKDVSYRRREDRQELPGDITLGLRTGKPTLRNSFLTDQQLNQLLLSSFFAYNTPEIDYDGLPTAFRCVASDLTTMTPVVFSKGSVVQAIRASISIPGIFPPYEIDGHPMVDGAITDNLPVDVLKRDLHADVILSVHFPPLPFKDADLTSITGVLGRASEVAIARNEANADAQSDVVISPQTAGFSIGDYSKSKALIEAGYEGAEQKSQELLQFALSEEAWKQFTAMRAARRRNSPGILNQVAVTGGSRGERTEAERDLNALVQQPLTARKIQAVIDSIEGNGSVSARYVTLPQAPSGDQPNVSSSTGENLAIELRPHVDGPPYLLAGINVSAANSNVARSTYNFRLVDQNFGGFGSELRTDLRLGFLTQLSTEYYRRLSARGLFLQPRLGFLRQPVYLWANQKRVSERLQQNGGGGLDLGFTISRRMQIAAEYRAEVVRWKLVSGEDQSPTPHLSGTAQTALLHYAFTSQQSGEFSQRGTHIDLRTGVLFNAAQSMTAPIIQAQISRAQPLPWNKAFLGIAGEVDTFAGRNVADPFRFTLGGPLRLSASSIDEYRGTDVYLARLAYIRQIAPLPTGIGQGLYGILGVEGGGVGTPEHSTQLEQDGFAGIIAATPIGAFTFGGSVGDAGRRKVFFQLGRLF